VLPGVSIACCLALAVTLLVPGSATAYVLNYGYWNPPYAYYANANAAPLSSSFFTAAKSGAVVWTNVTDCPFVFYWNESQGDLRGCTIGITNQGANGKLGVTYYTFNGTTITKAYTFLNSYYPLSTSPSSTSYDVQSIAAHEFGHWLPLGDSSVTSATMYGYIAKGETIKRTLATDDINGVRAKY